MVDDEPTIGEVVSAYLRRAGYETRVASDGFAALDAVSERSPDLIVLDLMLPGLDGLEVMRRVRDRPDRKSAIILLTAKGAEADRVIGLRLGADDYVVKPFSPAELVARVDAVLRRVDTVREEEPDLFDDELGEQIRQMLVEGVDVEAQFAEDLLGQGVAGLSTADMRSYLEYVADQRMQRLGLPRIYGSSNPLAFMELQDVQELSNFFERKVSAYQVGVGGAVGFDEDF